jgi:transcriptional regulator with XRE-family HTH domain
MSKNETDVLFGQYIKRVREARRPKLTQDEVCRLAHVHRNTVSNIENGESVSNGSVEKVMRVLGLEPMSQGRMFTGQAALVQALIGQWFISAPDTPEARSEAARLIVEFIETHPTGGSMPSGGGARVDRRRGGQMDALFVTESA